MWIYDENGELIKNEMVTELAGDTHIVHALNHIQEIHNKNFINNQFVFEYKGFSDPQAREDFIRLWNDTVKLIQIKLGTSYRVADKMNFETECF
jgi:hypothetical protein